MWHWPGCDEEDRHEDNTAGQSPQFFNPNDRFSSNIRKCSAFYSEKKVPVVTRKIDREAEKERGVGKWKDEGNKNQQKLS